MRYILTLACPISHKAPQLTGDTLSQISAIQGDINQFNTEVAHVSELQLKSLGVVDVASQNTAPLDDQVARTRDLGNQIKRRIEALKKQPVPRGQEARKNQACPPRVHIPFRAWSS
jgi:t-SNARE complex subunit (syntaxin)